MNPSAQNSEQFELHPTMRVIYGNGAVLRLGELVRGMNATSVLLVTDPGIRKAGHADVAIRSLQEAGLSLFVFEDVEENPTTQHVEKATAFATQCGAIDLIVALGGGSAMDTAKGVNFLLTNGGRMEDYWGFGKASKPMLPSIGIPTTAGTGSEAQSYALIEQEVGRRKMACGDLKARFHAVILDPGLTITAPFAVTAVSGMDAVTHAVESYVTIARTPVSQMYARQAWNLLERNFETVLREPNNTAARGAMLLGAHLAGMAIEASMLGAAHACANPLTSTFGVTHGVATGLMLPHVIAFNRPAAGGLYSELAEQLQNRIGGLLKAGNLPTRLRDCGVDESRLQDLARDAAEQWTGRYNPRPVAESDFLELYRNAF